MVAQAAAGVRRTRPPICQSLSVMECSLARHDDDALPASCLIISTLFTDLRRFSGCCTVAGHTDIRSGQCTAQTGYDVAFVRSSLQTVERLRTGHSFGDNPAVAKAGGLTRPLAGECAAG